MQFKRELSAQSFQHIDDPQHIDPVAAAGLANRIQALRWQRLFNVLFRHHVGNGVQLVIADMLAAIDDQISDIKQRMLPATVAMYSPVRVARDVNDLQFLLFAITFRFAGAFSIRPSTGLKTTGRPIPIAKRLLS